VSNLSGAHGGQEGRSFFESLLVSAGFCLDAQPQHTMALQPSAFSRTCYRAFNRKPDAVNEFIEGFRDYIADRGNLLKSLRAWKCASPAAPAFCVQQDTLVKLMLSSEHAQPALLELLIETMMGDGSDSTESEEEAQRLILNQIRWLDRIYDCETLVSNLLEAISSLPVSMQREVIESLPEVVDDRGHSMVVEKLQEFLQGDAMLMPSVLDAMTNLNLDDNLMSTVHGMVLPRLQSARIEDLPLLVKFLLHTVVDSPSGQNVIRGIRALEVDKLGTADVCAGQSEKTSAESLVVESLRSGFRSNFAISHAVLRELAKSKQLQSMDMWIIFVLHSLPGHRQKVCTICKKKSKCGAIPNEMVQRAVEVSPEAMSEFFADALAIAGTLGRAVDSGSRSSGITLYCSLFAAFKEDFRRLEVLGALITHSGSSQAREVNVGLGVLYRLSCTAALEIRRFLAHVQNIMDYVENLDDEQIRCLYSVFSMLALSELLSSGTMPQDDQIHIILKKQLAHAEPLYKRMGILGAVRFEP
jgi:Fanconi anemia group D2 protein